ncbi:MAG: hypothetical protein GY866_33440 [Proteobacteria bacterium]|nr:hypothetical protein [Pseudomonadota bacterium]
MNVRRVGAFFLWVLLFSLPVLVHGEKASSSKADFDIGYYQGQAVQNNFGDMLTNKWMPVGSYLRVVYLNYNLDGEINDLTFEVEGQIAKHNGLQNHWESNLLLVARLALTEEGLPTSIAYGQGLSYALAEPVLDDAADGDSARLLHYFFVELAIGFPEFSHDPRLVLRIHHRSGVFGVYCSDRCGSNIPAVGFCFSF